MNPARRDVPGCYLEPSPRPDDLVEPFPGADACRFMGASQHLMHHIILKSLPILRWVQRISPAMGCDALGGDEEHRWADPLTTGSSGSAGSSKGRDAGRHCFQGHSFLVLLVLNLHTVVGM